MSSRKLWICALLMGCACLGGSCSEMSIPPSFRKFEICYGPDDLTTLDIFVANHTSSPITSVVLFIHGGGWCSGDKTEWTDRHADLFVQQGFLCVCINYRLSSINDPQKIITHPTHVRDIAKAIAWVQNNISSYGGNPRKMILIGHSAGAHLAALVTINQKYLQDEYVDIKNIKQVFLLDAGSYLNTAQNIPAYMFPYFMAATDQANPLLLSDFIPLNYITEYREFPHFISITSSDEYRVKSNILFAERLNSQGIDATVHTVNIGDHYAVFTAFPYYTDLNCIDLMDLH